METRRVPPEHHADRDFELGVAGFRYPELHKPERLKQLHERFLEELEQAEPVLAGQFAAYRAAPPAGLAPPAESELLIQVARHVARFVARLFHIEARHGAQQAAAAQEAVLFRFKKDFVKWRSAKRKDPAWDETTFREREAALSSRGYELGDELAFARKVMAAVDREAALRTAGEEVERARLVEELAAQGIALTEVAARVEFPALGVEPDTQTATRERLLRELQRSQAKLADEDFVAKAPQSVVDRERQRAADVKEALERLDGARVP